MLSVGSCRDKEQFQEMGVKPRTSGYKILIVENGLFVDVIQNTSKDVGKQF